MLGFYREFPAIQRGDIQMIDTVRIGRQGDIGDNGVQENREIGNPLQIGGVTLAKIGRQLRAAHFAELEPAVVDAACAQLQRRTVSIDPLLVFAFVIERPSFDQGLRPRVIRLKRRARERPAGMRNPRPLLEIAFVQRPAPSAPMVCAAPQIMLPRGVERRIGHAGLRSIVERLGLVVETGAAAFQHEDADRLIGECQRQRDSGRATADDREICFDVGARRNCAGVGKCAQNRPFRKRRTAESLSPGRKPCLVGIVADGQEREAQSRFFAKARPDRLFRYFSKAKARSLSVNPMYVFTRQGLYFDV